MEHAIARPSSDARTFQESIMIVDSWARRWTILSSFLLTSPHECGDVLSPESAMPGAYVTACAAESMRYIPMRTNADDVMLNIPQGTVAPGSTGAVVWNSGILLKRLVESLLESGILHLDESVLELGCGGTGLVSAALAKSGLSSVVATDGNPEMIQQVRNMIELNDVSLRTAVYQWGSFDTSMLYNDHFDWIVGADLTYNPASWLALADSMAILADRSLYLTLGHGGSVQSELNSFLTAASDRLTVDEGMTKRVRNLLLINCLSKEERVFVEENGGVSVVVLRQR